MVKKLSAFCLLFALGLTSGCSQIELASHFGKKLTGGRTESQGAYKVGSPYTIKGKRYYPAVDYGYNKTGIASWYGPNFHGKPTANGERFDQNDLTAAHKTLPLPSIVRVTNLENGRSLVVRVNDRGPYAHGRIIDMSKRSAELLGFKNQGTAKVRVQVLEAESRKVAQLARDGHSTRGLEVPMNQPSYKVAQVQNIQPTIQKASYSTAQPQASAQLAHVSPAQKPVIGTPPPHPPRLFVQTGSFLSRDSAMKYASALDAYGRASVYSAQIDQKKYYRVRFHVQNTQQADMLLSRLIQDGHENALIVVD